ncbi:hypothetical protein E2C01_081142 [Portunus trituberculatus]|uniref:Uncharacterized protein n=1 Tax=Portunus trituberculatus TaxID=210409 RepID=A0A5B7IVU8_PORTR|nr:hypothetical protein [Portunus trituberculatus]
MLPAHKLQGQSDDQDYKEGIEGRKGGHEKNTMSSTLYTWNCYEVGQIWWVTRKEKRTGWHGAVKVVVDAT